MSKLVVSILFFSSISWASPVKELPCGTLLLSLGQLSQVLESPFVPSKDSNVADTEARAKELESEVSSMIEPFLDQFQGKIAASLLSDLAERMRTRITQGRANVAAVVNVVRVIEVVMSPEFVAKNVDDASGLRWKIISAGNDFLGSRMPRESWLNLVFRYTPSVVPPYDAKKFDEGEGQQMLFYCSNVTSRFLSPGIR